jgi:hypothetical protein
MKRLDTIRVRAEISLGPVLLEKLSEDRSRDLLESHEVGVVLSLRKKLKPEIRIIIKASV